MKRHAGTFPAVPLLKGLIATQAAPGLPMEKSMDVVKAPHRTCVKASWFSLSQNILCIIYRYDQWHFNK